MKGGKKVSCLFLQAQLIIQVILEHSQTVS